MKASLGWILVLFIAVPHILIAAGMSIGILLIQTVYSLLFLVFLLKNEEEMEVSRFWILVLLLYMANAVILANLSTTKALVIYMFCVIMSSLFFCSFFTCLTYGIRLRALQKQRQHNSP